MSTSLGKDSSEAISWLIEGDAGGADGRKLQPLTACLLIRSVKWKTSQVKMIRTKRQKQKHTTGGIPRWSPTLVLVARFSAYVWQSGRDAQFSLTYGRMCLFTWLF
jgi:hypothetical protein